MKIDETYIDLLESLVYMTVRKKPHKTLNFVLGLRLFNSGQND